MAHTENTSYTPPLANGSRISPYVKTILLSQPPLALSGQCGIRAIPSKFTPGDLKLFGHKLRFGSIYTTLDMTVYVCAGPLIALMTTCLKCNGLWKTTYLTEFYSFLKTEHVSLLPGELLALHVCKCDQETSKVEYKANQKQVGGNHYSMGDDLPQHWDLVDMYHWDYFQGQITKYIMRWRKKNGIQDLEKARHFLDKYIELEKAKTNSLYSQAACTEPTQGEQAGAGYVNQDKQGQGLPGGQVHSTYPYSAKGDGWANG